MDSRFSYTASQLSDEELKNRLENRQKYLPETTEASVTELQQRGHVFSEEELGVIADDINAQRENAELPYKGFGRYNGNQQNTIVEDPYAPGFYSRRAIWGFSLFCGALFGSVLLAINIGKVKNTKGVLLTLLFGVVLTALQVFVTETLDAPNSAAYFWGGLGGLILDYVLWKKFIGNATFYRVRPIWGPLVVAAVFLALIVLAMLSTQ
jgi:hypothetical protein